MTHTVYRTDKRHCSERDFLLKSREKVRGGKIFIKRNQCSRRSTGNYVAFCNNEIVKTPVYTGWKLKTNSASRAYMDY